jgi:hypothetical protein
MLHEHKEILGERQHVVYIERQQIRTIIIPVEKAEVTFLSLGTGQTLPGTGFSW